MDTDHQTVAIIVAHPDDETLWTGGTLIDHPDWQVFIACLCRKNDEERAGKFSKVLNYYRAKGAMSDLDDGPAQQPLAEKLVQRKILGLVPHKWFDLIITHSPDGEYTRHRRHEEIGKAVIKLWHSGKIRASALWTFAYEDGNRTYFPKAITNGTSNYELSWQSWQKKYNIITEIYGFATDSWEAMATPKHEAFWQFKEPEKAMAQLYLQKKDIK